MNISVDKTKEALSLAKITQTDAENNANKTGRRKTRFTLRFGIFIWLIVCIPSNILAMVFYFKQPNIEGAHRNHSPPTVLTNASQAFEIYEVKDRTTNETNEDNSTSVDEVRSKIL